MKIERSVVNESTELFKISIAEKSITVKTNRRLLKVLGKTKEQPSWEIIYGRIQDPETYEETINLIVEYMDEYEKKYPGYTYDTYATVLRKK